MHAQGDATNAHAGELRKRLRCTVLPNLPPGLTWRTRSPIFQHKLTGMSPVKIALAALKSLKQERIFFHILNIHRYLTDCSILAKRCCGIQGAQAAQYEPQRVLSNKWLTRYSEKEFWNGQ